MTFVLKKIITYIILPPGIIILFLLISVIFVKKRLKLLVLILALALYVCSIEPTGNMLLMPLEYTYKPPPMEDIRKCDVYVVLGGGINENAPSIDGEGTLTSDALFRLFEAYRLYVIQKKPIIFSGGMVFGKKAEADVARRLLLSLGLIEKHVIAESQSKDTYENAKFVKQICETYKFKKILLVTNAYHMKRSTMLFKKYFHDAIPYPVGYKTQKKPYNILSFLPDASNISAISIALKEYMGILFYKITL